jgi:distribution and morphology protein 34
MAFKFTWPTFSPSFYETASSLLTSALSKAPMPPIITDNIVVKEFNLGTTPPELEMLEIGELGDDKFRGVFKLKYSGDAFIVLQTKVQVSSLSNQKYWLNANCNRLIPSIPEVVSRHLLHREGSSPLMLR